MKIEKIPQRLSFSTIKGMLDNPLEFILNYQVKKTSEPLVVGELVEYRIFGGEPKEFIEVNGKAEFETAIANNQRNVVLKSHIELANKMLDSFNKSDYANYAHNTKLSYQIDIDAMLPYSDKFEFTGKIDILSMSGNSAVIVDYKTTGDLNRFLDSIEKYKYYLQLYIYMLLIKAKYPHIETVKTRLLVQSKTNYVVELIDVDFDKRLIDICERQLYAGARLFEKCIDTGKWVDKASLQSKKKKFKLSYKENETVNELIDGIKEYLGG